MNIPSGGERHNAWGMCDGVSTQGLSHIIAEQEEETQRNRNVRIENDEEADMVRLAVEASLRDVNKMNDGKIENNSECDLDDETRIALIVSKGKYSASMSQEEMRQILAAIREADDEEQARSVRLAMSLEAEEENYFLRKKNDAITRNGNIKLVNRLEYEAQISAMTRPSPAPKRELLGPDGNEFVACECDEDDDDDNDDVDVGFRLNNVNGSNFAWTRSKTDPGIIVGPDGEIRGKHDVRLKNQSNAQRLMAGHRSCPYVKIKNSNGPMGTTQVGDRAYNDFRRKMKSATSKGVAAHGHGRAENMDDHKTRGGVMDGHVRLEIQKAVNNQIIDSMNGVVKEGKEALLYHAHSSQYNKRNGLAIKIFKRIQEFRQRAKYVDGDPRYHKTNFGQEDKRHQVELWAEKEFRNLVRATRAGVSVPKPILQRQNILFMNFLGTDGWPSPQLRELNMKYGSIKWTAFYCQTLLAVKRLYCEARLVHGDLSEYNLLVCPFSQMSTDIPTDENTKDELRIVLIDFGQAVDTAHPSSEKLLRHDINRIMSFYAKKGVGVLDLDTTTKFITHPPPPPPREETNKESGTNKVNDSDENEWDITCECKEKDNHPDDDGDFVVVQSQDTKSHDNGREENYGERRRLNEPITCKLLRGCRDKKTENAYDENFDEHKIAKSDWDEKADLVYLKELLSQIHEKKLS